MAQIKQKIKGEYTFVSEFSEAPEGALKTAENCNINRDSVAESRRGFDYDKAISSTSSDRGDQLLNYKTDLIAHYGSSLSRDSSDPMANIAGTFNPPDHNDSYVPKIKSAEVSGNFYFTSQLGIQKQSALGGSVTNSGAPSGLDMTGSLTGASGFMSDSTAVAYRHLWGYKDANNNLILGTPSQRVLLSNSTGSSANVSLEISIPFEVSTSWFLQIYRSGLSSSASIDPGDELQLVYEGNPVSADITNKYLTVVDSTPDSLRGASLYTDASQQGIAQANDRPPSAKDIALFKNCTFYANTIQKQNTTTSLLAAGTSTGINFATTTGDPQSGTKTILNVASTTGISIGMFVRGIGIPDGSQVSTIVSTTITITASGNITATTVGTALQFYDTVTVNSVAFEAYNATQQSITPITMTIASPGVITTPTAIVANGDTIIFSTTGALPTGLVAGTKYFAVGVSGATFKVSATFNSTQINTSGSQSGVHSIIVNSKRFKVLTSGTPAQNIESTAQNLCKSINRNYISVLAYYISGPSDLPGKIFFEALAYNQAAFDVASIKPTFFSPTLTLTSTAEGVQNRLHCSKVQQPEACPRAQYFPVGSQNSPILRIIPLRDSLVIAKSEGFFRLSGTTPSNFLVDPLDLTTSLLAPETAVAGNNQIFCLANQGACAVTETGVGVISRPIEDLINPLLSWPDIEKNAFGVFYNTERQYLLFLPSEQSLSIGDLFYSDIVRVYNTFTQAWTHWLRDATAGIINSADNKLYMTSPNDNKLRAERKDLVNLDYSDEMDIRTISAKTSTTITIDSLDGIRPLVIKPGALVIQGGNSSYVTSVSFITGPKTVLTMDAPLTWALSTCSVYTPIPVTISFASQYCQNPGVMKHIREVALLFKTSNFDAGRIMFDTDLVPSQGNYLALPLSVSLTQSHLRIWPSTDSQRCSWIDTTFTLEKVRQSFLLCGVEYTFETLSERTGV